MNLKNLKEQRRICKDDIRQCIKTNNLWDGTFKNLLIRLDNIDDKIENIY